MAISRCPHCNSTSFELSEGEPYQSRYKFHFVQCGHCGAPFGVIDFEHVPTLIDGLEERLGAIESRLGI
jgi:hydrogenase maturation factor HypF (carbamoyltransferase family)